MYVFMNLHNKLTQGYPKETKENKISGEEKLQIYSPKNSVSHDFLEIIISKN